MREILAIIGDQTIRAGLQQAWEDSMPGPSGGHEEGGFIVQDSPGNIHIVRWPKGEHNAIAVPPHPNCKFAGNEIIFSFHTHPNTGDNYLQEPSETDCRAVRDDPHLKGTLYKGELVITHQNIYLVARDGNVALVGETNEILP